MINKFSQFWSWIKRHKIWSIIIAVVVLGLIWHFTFGNKKEVNTQFAVVERGTVREEVSVTGNVKPLSAVDLAFERGGRVASINVAVGDKVYSGQTLASVSNADLVANLNQAQANLKKVKASFGNNADQAALDLVQARITFINSVKDSYTKSDDAVRNKFYSLFNDPVKYNSKLSFSTDPSLKEDLEDGHNVVTNLLNNWSEQLSGLDASSDLSGYYQTAKTNLDLIKSLLDKSAEAVNGLSSNPSTSQTEIDTWKLNISTARININSTVTSLTASYDQFASAALAIKISKNSTLAEEANIEAAQAEEASAEAELAKSIIRSPIAGVVTDIPIKLGEIISANQKALVVISYGDYEVETFVPEADISKIKIGNMASTTLDAYGAGVNFDTDVIKIDPAATVIDGVPTYKVTLKFMNQDDRVRSGMTANLDVLTAEKANVLTIPVRAVYSKEDGKYVKIVGVDNLETEKKIEVGLRGFDGKVEVVSGLIEGEKVSTAL